MNTNIGYISNDLWLPFINNFKKLSAYCYWAHKLELNLL